MLNYKGTRFTYKQDRALIVGAFILFIGGIIAVIINLNTGAQAKKDKADLQATVNQGRALENKMQQAIDGVEK